MAPLRFFRRRRDTSVPPGAPAVPESFPEVHPAPPSPGDAPIAGDPRYAAGGPAGSGAAGPAESVARVPAPVVGRPAPVAGEQESAGAGAGGAEAAAGARGPAVEAAEAEPHSMERAIAGWMADVRELWEVSPLSDMSRMRGALLDLTGAHPSGIAQLYAGRVTRLTNLVREAGALAEARRTACAVREQAADLAQRYGLAPLYLVVGVAHWTETNPESGERRAAEAPVLMRAVRLELLDPAAEDMEVVLEPGLEVNPELSGALARAGVALDVAELAAMAVTEHGFMPRAALVRLTELGNQHLADFEMSERIYVGPFVHPGEILLEDLRATAGLMAQHPLVQALAGDLEVKRQLAGELPPTRVEDRAPDAERGVGDLDPVQHGAVELVAAGHNLVLDARPGSDAAGVLAAVLADAAGTGRRVVLLAGTRRAARAAVKALDSRGLGDIVLDLHDPSWRTAAPAQLRESLAPWGGQLDAAAVRAARAQLLAARARLEGYMDALHQPRERWETSAYETLQHLADLATSTGPRTRVRLDADAIFRLDESTRAEATEKLQRLAILGGFSLRRTDTPWFGANVRTRREATAALERSQVLAEVVLPRVLEEVERISAETGLNSPESLGDWLEQLEMLRGVRASLDLFSPHVFERSAADMVIATASPQWREVRGVKMPGGARRRLVKQARDMVRPGVAVADLHASLVQIQRQREVWRRHCPAGGWPKLPSLLGEAERSAADAERLLRELAEVFPKDDLFAQPIATLQGRLLELGSDSSALRYLPELNSIMVQLENLGLGALVADLRARHVAPQNVAEELELCWWASVLEAIIMSDPALAEHDGASLNSLAEKFRELDRVQVASLAGPVRRAVDRRRAALIAANKDAAQELWRELAGRPVLSYLRATFPDLVTAGRPIWVLPPLAIPHAIPPTADIDLLIVDGAGHLPTSHCVSAIARSRQVVLIGDVSRPPAGVVGELAGTLPTFALPTDRARREEHIASFLAGHGYETDNSVPPPPSPARIRLHKVEGFGLPTIGAVAVEGVPAEVNRVVDLIADHREESLAVISLSPITAQAIREAVAAREDLRELLVGEDPLPIVDVEEAAGLVKDTVILSVGFAKTPHGRVLHRFGAVSTPEGLALMIDALAAVRHNLEVVSCLAPGDLDEDRLHHAGAVLLGNLLDFASDSPPEPGSSKARSQPLVGEPDRLLLDLAARLERLGLVVIPRYGFEGGVRIPLVVGHRDRPGELFVAVVTDDEDYIAEPSLRRRDRHWVERLEALGWIPHMAFATAVFMDPQREARAIAKKVELAMAARGGGAVSEPEVAPPPVGQAVSPGDPAGEAVGHIETPAEETATPTGGGATPAEQAAESAGEATECGEDSAEPEEATECGEDSAEPEESAGETATPTGGGATPAAQEESQIAAPETRRARRGRRAARPRAQEPLWREDGEGSKGADK